MSQKISDEMQDRALRALSVNGGFQFTRAFFPYASGQIGSYYIQSGDVMKNGVDFGRAVNDMTEAVKNIRGERMENLVISGGETRDWIFSNAVGANLKLPTVMINKDGKTVGASMKGKSVLHVADLNNEGSSPRDLWVPAIRTAGGNIEEILFYVDRMEDGVDVMRELGLRSYAIATLDAHAWDFLQKLPSSGLTPEICASLMKRMEDKENWAREMLRSDAGLETLAALIISPKSRKQGQKVMDVGYPDMRYELTKEFKHRFGSGIGRWINAGSL